MVNDVISLLLVTALFTRPKVTINNFRETKSRKFYCSTFLHFSGSDFTSTEYLSDQDSE